STAARRERQSSHKIPNRAARLHRKNGACPFFAPARCRRLLFEILILVDRHIFDGVFFALGVEHEQSLVTVLHCSSVLLKVFIAETSPLSITHFTASTARSIVELTSGLSSSKNRLNT